MLGSQKLWRNALIAALMLWLGGEWSAARAMAMSGGRSICSELGGGSKPGIPSPKVTTISNAFDGLGRLKETWLKKSDGTGLDFYRYTYDSGWRRSQYLRHNSDKLVIGYDDLGQVPPPPVTNPTTPPRGSTNNSATLTTPAGTSPRAAEAD